MFRSTLVLSLSIALLTASEAVAAPINIVPARGVEIGSNGGLFLDSTSNGVGPFSAAISHPVAAAGGGLKSVGATQLTIVDGSTGLMAGTGSASVGYSVLASDGIHATSFFDVFFDLASPHGYSLGGDLAASSDGGYAWAGLSLTGPTSMSFLATPFVQSTLLSASGVLPAGSYRLVVQAVMDNGGDFQQGAAMGGDSAFNFEFQLTPRDTPVPEPVSGTLLLVGLALLARRRRATA
jgi:hypothetical protein